MNSSSGGSRMEELLHTKDDLNRIYPRSVATIGATAGFIPTIRAEAKPHRR